MVSSALESGVYKSYFIANGAIVKCLFEQLEQRLTALPGSDRPLEVGPCSLDRTWYLTTNFPRKLESGETLCKCWAPALRFNDGGCSVVTAMWN
jgi:hypothetical protein